MKNRKGKKIAWAALLLVVAIFIAYIAIQYFVVGAKQAGVVNGKLSIPDFPYKPWIVMLYVHIIAGSAAFILGPFQFMRSPVGRRAALHRKVGYLYIGSIALAGTVGFYLCWFATGGIITGLGFLMLDLLWITTTGMALLRVIQKKFTSHKHWMIRSYAVTFAFVTFRLYLIPFTALFGLSINTSMNIASWVCWLTNLILIEVFLRRSTRAKHGNIHIQIEK